MKPELGEIVLYQSEDGSSAIDVQLKDETVWLSRKEMAVLFDRDYKTISKHINNVFKEGELRKNSVVSKNATTGNDGKTYQVEYYNLDVIISVGYRVKSQRGTQFRIWATSVLKDHLVRGFSVNQKRLAEKGTEEMQQVLSLLANTLDANQLVNDEGRAVLHIVNHYAKTWNLLLQYDEDALPLPKVVAPNNLIELAEGQAAISTLKKELTAKGEATELFGQERGDGLNGIFGAIQQTFGGQDLYPGMAEKAANLLYFVIKDHPFSDGNKRIGTFLFLLFLKKNGCLDGCNFPDNALVALTLLTAASDPAQKDILVRLIVNLISKASD
ncbi:Putative DNA-binding protein in cluster with Type I restriction-modification system [hydrothermal vent metagenome]|uniref:DNA-binding protein in cluster with Type I restriction-modification system n=1 Tax=hydrothermal vent metagenome TaxID=652676 RepID=A0A3B0V177_9ZZZZ